MSVNKVMLIGHVGKAPEIKHFENGVVANFSLATSEKGYKTKAGKEIPDRTEWHNIIVWGGLAKVVEKYVTSGTPLYLEGKIRNRSYDHTDGTKRYVTEIYVEELELLGRKPETTTSSVSAPANESNDFDPSPITLEDDLPF